MMWTAKMTDAYRAETERRFRERTPPANDDLYSFDPACRVGRAEMRTWSDEQFGIYPPEVDMKWIESEAKWYRALIKRVCKELGEDLYEKS